MLTTMMRRVTAAALARDAATVGGARRASTTTSSMSTSETTGANADATAFANELLSEELDVEHDEGLESPAHLDARAYQLRARAMELEHDADAMYAKAHRRVRVRAREMMRRALAARDDARECESRARLLREQARDEGRAYGVGARRPELEDDIDARDDGRHIR